MLQGTPQSRLLRNSTYSRNQVRVPCSISRNNRLFMMNLDRIFATMFQCPEHLGLGRVDARHTVHDLAPKMRGEFFWKRRNVSDGNFGFGEYWESQRSAVRNSERDLRMAWREHERSCMRRLLNSVAKSRARFGCDLNLDTHMLTAAIMQPPEPPLQRAYNL